MKQAERAAGESTREDAGEEAILPGSRWLRLHPEHGFQQVFCYQAVLSLLAENSGPFDSTALTG